MEDLQNKMREIAKSLLSEKKVAKILGQREGTLPLRTQPVVITKEDDVLKLVWNEYSDINLVELIPKGDEKVGVILKTCDVKNVAVLINENQIKKENLVIIGMPCVGLIDRKRIQQELKGKEITDAKITDSEVVVSVRGGEKSFKKSAILLDVSEDPIPPIIDHLVDTPASLAKPEKPDEFAEVEEFEKKSPQERWEYFKDKLKDCIRCYACRNACPLCYCKECFVDINRPQWFGKTMDVGENVIFHLIRAIHLAGRCVGCEACSRACPMDIDLRLINKKLRKVVQERWGFTAGEDLEKVCPMAAFNINDPQEFIIEEGE